mgnify:FL=1
MTYSYKVKDITGDYAVLLRTDIKTEDTIIVAMALLPDGTDIGSDLLWENLEYTLVNWKDWNLWVLILFLKQERCFQKEI